MVLRKDLRELGVALVENLQGLLAQLLRLLLCLLRRRRTHVPASHGFSFAKCQHSLSEEHFGDFALGSSHFLTNGKALSKSLLGYLMRSLCSPAPTTPNAAKSSEIQTHPVKRGSIILLRGVVCHIREQIRCFLGVESTPYHHLRTVLRTRSCPLVEKFCTAKRHFRDKLVASAEFLRQISCLSEDVFCFFELSGITKKSRCDKAALP
mmetsp:Transcript_14127/g.32610  ORF Transcript_14127/g.32610 Transcript_14127/m.32610 type:complete len:208 (-) Transcript_14127:1985-2608(-)